MYTKDSHTDCQTSAILQRIQAMRMTMVRREMSSQLHTQWIGVVIATAGMLTLLYAGLHVAVSGMAARGWALVAVALAAYELWFLGRHLRANHAPNHDAIFPTLGAGTLITLFRGVSVAAVAGFIFMPAPDGLLAWLPAALYTVAIIADFFDGYVARLTNQVTRLGERLDMEFDGLSLLVAVALAIHYDQLPFWFLLFGIPRYLFIVGLWQRKRTGAPVYDLPPSVTRRVLAGLMMGFASVVIWPLFSPPGTLIAGLLFGVPFLAGFLRDWLIVSGRIDPTVRWYQTVQRRGSRVLLAWLPLVLRAGFVVVAGIWLLPRMQEAVGRVMPALIVRGPTLSTVILAGTTLAATVMLGVGAAGRLAAFILLVPVCLNILAFDYQPYHTVLLAGTILIMVFGTGALSAWQPEDHLLHKHPGA